MLRTMTMEQQRPIASLPHPSSSAQAPPQPRKPLVPAYNPDPRELHPGAKNRLFLSLHSGIESEIDWALPRLVSGSFENPELFKLETWVDSVGALQAWPEKWLAQLESEAALFQLRNGQTATAKKEVLAMIPEWIRDPNVEIRATNSLVILRNASFAGTNAKIICRPRFIAFITRFFSLPTDFLLEVSLSSPEPFQNLLVILQSIFPHIPPDKHILHIFGEVLPSLLVDTRDLAILNLLLPLCISGMSLSNISPPPTTLIPHLLHLITLTPPAPLLDLNLDLLISLTQDPQQARASLAQPSIPAHLRSLVILLEYAARPTNAAWDPPTPYQSVMVRNPASGAVQAEESSRRRDEERAYQQKVMFQSNGTGVRVDVGDKPPALNQAIKAKLYALPEPQRSIAWMHETFIYSSISQLLQVTFWHAYRDFFQHPSTVDQLLSASEVIKNVTTAFPGASAKVWIDERGEQKFVIAGMGFRPASDVDERFTCRWRGCRTPQGCSDPAQLWNHIATNHWSAGGQLNECCWGTCTHTPLLESHIYTHIPTIQRPPVTEYITTDTQTPVHHFASKRITNRPPPPVPKSIKLSFTGLATPQDQRRNPTGVSFLAALIIRNLARTLRSEIQDATPNPTDPDHGLTKVAKEEKKRHLMEERFGLPIPDSVVREEEEEDKAALKEDEERMTGLERDRARVAFEGVEERLLGVVERNVSGLAVYLGDAFGW